jgi:FlaA1/EpsC-like NDP-sugar epimerase
MYIKHHFSTNVITPVISNLGIIDKIVSIVKKSAGTRSIYIWGAGNSGCQTFKTLQDHSLVISGFIDKDEKKVGENFMGLQVYSPYIISDHLLDKPYIIIASMYAGEIETCLREYGYIVKRDFRTNLYQIFDQFL